MQLTIEHIEQNMAGVDLTPGQVADFRTYLAAIYSLYANEMKDILAVKPGIWLNLRGEKNSDKANGSRVAINGERNTRDAVEVGHAAHRLSHVGTRD
jgi:hypothetical protein